MDMTTIMNKTAGGSDTRHRQGELIFPGVSRSGREDKSYDGLPSALTASVGGELAIAGGVCTCSAGVHVPNAPANGRARGQMPPWDQREKEGETLRLRGGGGVEGGREAKQESQSLQQMPTRKGGQSGDSWQEVSVLLDKTEADVRLAGLRAEETMNKEDTGKQERARDREKPPVGARAANRIESDESDNNGSSGPERSRRRSAKRREGN